MRRLYSYDDLAKRTRFVDPAWVRVSRNERVRRKPRAPEETAMLERIVVKRIDQARATGELTKVGERLRIRV